MQKPRRWMRDENLQPEDNRKPGERAVSETFPVLALTHGQRVARLSSRSVITLVLLSLALLGDRYDAVMLTPSLILRAAT
jgi:hypothetical protein